MVKKEKEGLSESEIKVFNSIEKFTAQNERAPNIKELSKETGFSKEKVKQNLDSLTSKGILKINKEGSSKRIKIVKYIIPAFLGTTGAFVGYKILSERQMKQAAKEQEKVISVETLFPKSKDLPDKPIDTITIPETPSNREIVYIPTEGGGYKPQPINITYAPAPIDFGDKTVTVYGGGGGEGDDFDELWQQLLTIIGDKNCAMQNKSQVESGVMSYQQLYQICAGEGATVTIEDETEVGALRKFTCNLQNCYWDDSKDLCDCTKDKHGNPKEGGGKTFDPEEGSEAETMTDVLTGKYEYDPQDKEEEPAEGYDPFALWQKEHGDDSQPEVDTTEPATPSSPQFSPLGGKTPCASHSTEAECVANGCTWFKICQTS